MYYVICTVDMGLGHGARQYHIECEHRKGIIAGVGPGDDPYYHRDAQIIAQLKMTIPCHVCRLREHSRLSE